MPTTAWRSTSVDPVLRVKAPGGRGAAIDTLLCVQKSVLPRPLDKGEVGLVTEFPPHPGEADARNHDQRGKGGDIAR